MREFKLECRVTKKIWKERWDSAFLYEAPYEMKRYYKRKKGEGGLEEEKLHSWYLKYGNYHMANRIPAVTPGFVRNLMNCKKPLFSF